MRRLNWVTLGIVLTMVLSLLMSGCASKEQLDEAYNEGYQLGYNEAYTPAHEKGYTVGYNEGNKAGYDNGHIIGYNKGLTDMEQSLDELRRELEEAYRQVEKPTYGDMFFFYYAPLGDQQYGVEKLEACLNKTWKEEVYKAGIFDCSEMSAFLEWYLENKGWHTKIKVGKSVDGSGGRHAWLLVETRKGKYMPVEATQWSIVYWDNPFFENYFDAERNFETIQEALEYSPTGFDWWAS